MDFLDKSILITGGTGSFDKRCVKVILERYKPRKVSVYSRDELKKLEMQQDFKSEVMGMRVRGRDTWSV